MIYREELNWWLTFFTWALKKKNLHENPQEEINRTLKPTFSTWTIRHVGSLQGKSILHIWYIKKNKPPTETCSLLNHQSWWNPHPPWVAHNYALAEAFAPLQCLPNAIIINNKESEDNYEINTINNKQQNGQMNSIYTNNYPDILLAGNKGIKMRGYFSIHSQECIEINCHLFHERQAGGRKSLAVFLLSR